MVSIQLKLRQTDTELVDKADRVIKTEDGREYYFIPLILKKIHNGLFAELDKEDLPEAIKIKFDKIEISY